MVEEASAATPEIFTKTSAISLAAVATLGLVAYIGSKYLLPKNARWQDRFTFIWVVRVIFSAQFSPLLTCLDYNQGFWRNDSLFIWRFMGFFVHFWPAGQHERRTLCWDVCVAIDIWDDAQNSFLVDNRRERVCPRRFPMGLFGRDNSLSRNFDRPWSWSNLLLYIEAAHQRWPRPALLDCGFEHSGIIWRVRVYFCNHRRPVR